MHDQQNVKIISRGFEGCVMAFQSSAGFHPATGNDCFITVHDKVQSSADHASLTLCKAFNELIKDNRE